MIYHEFYHHDRTSPKILSAKAIALLQDTLSKGDRISQSLKIVIKLI
ncbi:MULTISPECIES: hypothetical protein [Spirulina sp. CCY15215]|nr:hypothetical protein [Spirulina major]